MREAEMKRPEIDLEFGTVAERRRYERGVIRDFVEGARAGNGGRVWRAICEVNEGRFTYGGWRAVMRAIAKVDDLPDWFRENFLRGLWLTYGDHIRQETSDDLVLIGGLRALLPRYAGPAKVVFRGEGAGNRRRRTYGCSWTESIEVARAYDRLAAR
jgi:hypothetical protein